MRDVHASVHRPDRELRAFAKVRLAPGERARVQLELPPRAFAFFDTAVGDWYVEPGDFELLVGASSEDIRLTAALPVAPSATSPPRRSVGGEKKC